MSGETESQEALRDRTIQDFGEQWSHYRDNDGYYGSRELLEDVLGPLMAWDELAGLRVADLGSGTGRFARLFLEAGADQVLAVEPSEAASAALESNLEAYAERARILKARGDELPGDADLDLVFSFGVLQFIPDPLPTLLAARRALRPGGRIVFWVYGREGLRLYAALARALRMLTVRLPHFAIDALCSTLNLLIAPYIVACRFLPLPLHRYAREVFAKLSWKHRKLVIYDQLNPTYVRFYSRQEVLDLLQQAGFERLRVHHRGGYSWTALGTKGETHAAAAVECGDRGVGGS